MRDGVNKVQAQEAGKDGVNASEAKPVRAVRPDDPADAERFRQLVLDYRAGVVPLRQLGRQYGVSAAALIKWAKRFGWSRDLRQKIDQKAQAKIDRAAVNAAVNGGVNAKRPCSDPTERQVIEANAEAIARVRLEHRDDLQRTRKLVHTLLSELEAATEQPEEFARLAGLRETSTVNGSPTELTKAYHRAVSRSGRVSDLKALTEALKNLIALERQAWGLETRADDSAATPSLTDTERATRLARIIDLAKMRREASDSQSGACDAIH